ncbi:MAG: hypothetical protein MJ142_03065, partial [Clostridia bacterium]|nr:hypothetical protein [Clostridia bacterium]
WDEETGMYYLRNRYYSVQFSRMLNSDRIEVLFSQDISLANRNLFSYCDNDPVNRSDSDGNLWNIVIGAIVGGVIGAAVSVATQLITTGVVDGSQVAVATISGAISGGFAATGIAVGGQMAVNGVIGAVSGIADYCFGTPKEKFSVFEMLKEAVNGAGVGIVSGCIGGNGTGSIHLASSRKALIRALKKGKPLRKALKYWYSQTLKESINCGRAAIPAIFHAAVPGTIVSLCSHEEE